MNSRVHNHVEIFFMDMAKIYRYKIQIVGVRQDRGKSVDRKYSPRIKFVQLTKHCVAWRKSF